ncbi:ferredoxin [Actinomycetospora sp. TBRC 11914]|uniref:ferredoxin n=1 Tax=Actinomycetospora sp. TBRC 11914 TaxID=2729387 RepID=UPI00145DD575|nr:ferredoxin [Actinomycetospora sp. TBRC 11914]NMO91654.1 ferredoxin [Actinomycetospora sp. TBRC 11914]
MKVTLDESLCEAHGECVLAAPEVFDLDDDSDVAVLLDDSPPEDQRENVVMAARLCPVAAITVED